MNEIVEQIKKLPIPDRIRLVEDIWDSIAEAPPEAFEFTSADREELHRRLAAHLADPDSGVSWERVRTRLFAGGG